MEERVEGATFNPFIRKAEKKCLLTSNRKVRSQEDCGSFPGFAVQGLTPEVGVEMAPGSSPAGTESPRISELGSPEESLVWS